LPFTPAQVFDAFADVNKITKWWGPDGFSNKTDVFEFRPGGRWVHTMIGPNGEQYPNRSIFIDIEPNHRLVMDHDCAPLYTFTLTLREQDGRTLVCWDQAFENASTLEKLRRIIEPANEQNFNRLEALLKKLYA